QRGLAQLCRLGPGRPCRGGCRRKRRRFAQAETRQDGRAGGARRERGRWGFRKRVDGGPRRFHASSDELLRRRTVSRRFEDSEQEPRADASGSSSKPP
ncbi:hypothetical protein AAVH_23380, partial [Aphelenchoides avenae]